MLFWLVFSLILLNVTASHSCTQDSDCNKRYYCSDSKCKIERMFPLNVLSVFGFVVFFLLSIAACLSGIGGGVFNVPLALLFYSMSMADAVPVSVCIVFVVMSFRYGYCLVKKLKHPKKDRPIVDYDLAMLISPSIFTGTIIGVTLNKMFHEWILLVLYSLVMVYMFRNSYQKWDRLRKQENRLQANAKLLNENQRQEEEDQKGEQSNKQSQSNSKGIVEKINRDKNDTQQKPSTAQKDRAYSDIPANASIMLRNIISKEQIQIPFKKILLIIIGIFFLLMLSLLKGTKEMDSIAKVQYCGVGYWLFQVAFLPIALALLFVGYRILNKEHQDKLACDYHFLDNDIRYDKKNLLNINFFGFMIGFLSSLLGIGGGILITPIMLILKLDPTVASYTASFMTLFTSFVNAVQYLLIGIDTWDYIIASTIFALGGFIVGLWLLTYIKNDKQSYIVLTLVIVIIIASALVVFMGITNTIDSYDKGVDVMKIMSIC